MSWMGLIEYFRQQFVINVIVCGLRLSYHFVGKFLFVNSFICRLFSIIVSFIVFEFVGHLFVKRCLLFSSSDLKS